MELLVTSLIFLLAHAILSSARVRRALVGQIGLETCEICASSISFALFAALIVSLQRFPFDALW